MSDLDIQPLLVVGWEGVIGSLVMLCGALPALQRSPYPEGSGLAEDTVGSWCMLRNSWAIAGGLHRGCAPVPQQLLRECKLPVKGHFLQLTLQLKAQAGRPHGHFCYTISDSTSRRLAGQNILLSSRYYCSPSPCCWLLLLLFITHCHCFCSRPSHQHLCSNAVQCLRHVSH